MSDELTRALRELAAQNETPPTVAGTQIRSLAARRTRRRRTTLALGTGAAALALAAVALTLNTGTDTGPDHRPPAATPHLTSPAPSPSTSGSPAPSPSASGSPAPSVSAVPTAIIGTVDFEKHTLTIDGRTVPIAAGSPTLLSAGVMTVTAKLNLDRDSVAALPKTACKTADPHVVELRDTGRTSIYVGAFSCSDDSGARIRLDTKDAVWLYKSLKPGDVIAVVLSQA
ncbi:hypothetical protein EDD90_6067 [Streptomyces sp. Ag109_O5-1]|uniref:hypothetical protein n=1 Tax=Streptomyces sp. Ag109_O5-1 TaxID=1938851 RepID=UPI000F9295ED|nr:hypothetical protein [Streptomyces sp. Ag109_O5-1]RPE42901.1 hypothetical protein EDD90_6067 [Streptomyces sp. Ag109_O5-1]